MPIEPRTDDYVPGGTWLDAPGSGMLLYAMKVSCQLTSVAALECGLYALAMAMATEPDFIRPLDWSSGSLEKRYYNALQEIQTQYLGFDDENYLLGEGDLCDIIARWGLRYKDTYGLYIDVMDNIQLEETGQESTEDTKVILLRCLKNRWQACCYFEEGIGSVNTSTVDLSSDQSSAPQSSDNSMHNQLSDSTTAKASEKYDNAINEVNKIFTSPEFTNERLANTLERLATGVENVALAIEAREKSEERLYVAIDKLTASLDKATQAAQAQPQRSFDVAINNYGTRTSTENDPGFNTPSTVQGTELPEFPADYVCSESPTSDGLIYPWS